jgi:ubiquinone/menaquinone biosynthesis C-methylase UbiE
VGLTQGRVLSTFDEIYASRGEDYDALVDAEDHEGNILPALAAIAPLRGARVVEFGAGTGRLTRLLGPIVEEIRAFDASAHMLSVAERRLRQMGLTNWTVGVADNRRLPVEWNSADIAIAGWTFGHAVDWFPEGWRDEIQEAIDEMSRVLVPGGVAIVLETMTTGSMVPAPPTDGLASYYRWLETEHGFRGTTIRTDYRFSSADEAERLIGFFFGDQLAEQLRRGNGVVLPENTGIWSRRERSLE